MSVGASHEYHAEAGLPDDTVRQELIDAALTGSDIMLGDRSPLEFTTNEAQEAIVMPLPEVRATPSKRLFTLFEQTAGDQAISLTEKQLEARVERGILLNNFLHDQAVETIAARKAIDPATRLIVTDRRTIEKRVKPTIQARLLAERDHKTTQVSDQRRIENVHVVLMFQGMYPEFGQLNQLRHEFAERGLEQAAESTAVLFDIHAERLRVLYRL